MITKKGEEEKGERVVGVIDNRSFIRCLEAVRKEKVQWEKRQMFREKLAPG